MMLTNFKFSDRLQKKELYCRLCLIDDVDEVVCLKAKLSYSHNIMNKKVRSGSEYFPAKNERIIIIDFRAIVQHGTLGLHTR